MNFVTENMELQHGGDDDEMFVSDIGSLTGGEGSESEMDSDLEEGNGEGELEQNQGEQHDEEDDDMVGGEHCDPEMHGGSSATSEKVIRKIIKDFTIHKLIADNFDPKIGVAIVTEADEGKTMLGSKKYGHATIAFNFGDNFVAAHETRNLRSSRHEKQ